MLKIFLPPIAQGPLGEYGLILVPGCHMHPGIDLHNDPETADFVLLVRHQARLHGTGEMEDKLDHYLAHEDDRFAIARSGFEHAMACHKVSDRIGEIIAEIT